MLRLLLILLMAFSLTQNPTTAATSGTGAAWSDPAGRVLSSNNTWAVANMTGATTSSQDLTVRDFDFPIHATGIIRGIELNIERSITSSLDIVDQTVQLLKGGVAVGDNKASGTAWTGGDAVITYGGSTELWGTTWTPAEINDSGFGALVKVTRTTEGAAWVDHIFITVYFEVGGSATITFAPTATVNGVANLQGSSTITFTSAGIISGPAALSGSTTIVFAPAATISGPAALSGGATIAFDSSGDIFGTAELSGGATIVFTVTGDLVEAGVGSGRAEITFTASADIHGIAILSGSASISFASSADIAGPAELQGGARILFDNTATIEGLGELAGSATIVFSAHGMFTVEPEKPLRVTRRPYLTLPGGQQANLR